MMSAAGMISEGDIAAAPPSEQASVGTIVSRSNPIVCPK
jgi:hypothetical protein